MTPNQLAIQLAATLGKSIGTVRSWIKKGMPTDSLEVAIEWVETGGLNIRRPEAAAIAAVKELQAAPPLIDSNAPMAELLQDFPQAVQIAVALREAGATQSKICEATGFTQRIVTKICREHPDLVPKEKEFARKDWEDVRRMSLGRLKELLGDDEAARRFKPAELATVAGIAADKVDREDAAVEISFSICTKINGLSYEELINSIPKQTFEGEFTMATGPCQLPEFKPRDIPRLVQPEDELVENASDL